MISPETSFDLVHVGKCGGSSVAAELRAGGFKFEHFHLRRPVAISGHRYVVLVRDPVARFISAFNWRHHLLEQELLPTSRQEDPIVSLRHRAEREFLLQFENVNAFAEQLVPTGEYEVSAIRTMMGLIGHVPQGFVWYLDGLLNRIEPEQLMGVISTEHLADDFQQVFGFRLAAERNRNDSPRGTSLSPMGRANLVRELEADYHMLDRLAELARRAGVPLSVEYSMG